MVLYFANRKMDILGLASTELMEGFTISKDMKSEDTDTGVATFECTIHWTEETRALAETCASAGNYLLRSHDYENEFYTIIEVEVDTKDQTIYIYAEDAGMDLLNETVGAYAATSAMPIADYVEMYAMDTGFEIGINEIENLSRTLSWTGTATAAERIASVATQFDNAEISYSFDIKELTITHKYINIHKKRGKDAGVQLRLNRDVDRIITTTSVADLATALYVTGGTPDDSENPITLDGYSYDDGDMYVEDGLLKSRDALAVWSRYVWAKEPGQIEGYTGHIVKQWSYDTTSQSELCNRAITQLKKVCEPAVNYEIDIQMLPENVGVGDYVDIVDEKGELYLSSRILQLKTSVCDQQQTATLGEFLIVESGISQTVKDLAEQFSQLAKTRQYYVWIVYADDEFGDGISLDPTGKAYMGTCTTTAGAEPDLSDPSIYKWSLIQGENGVGIEEINTYYGVSDSPADIPTVWQDEPINDLGNNEYQWSYTETIYTNGTSEMTSPTIIAYYSYLEVDELTATVANIESLLAGEVGTGALQAIYLSSANVVIADATITDAMIANLTADKITSGTIYTDYVQIANNTAEQGQFMLIDHSTIQINDGNVMRVQIGEDAEGDYNLYLWDEDENLLWNAKGLTESGVSGNGGIIKNVAVADDAAIQGHKLDIQSVASELSEDGTLTVNAGNVYIGDDRLDYALNTIEEQIAGLEGVTTEGIVTFYSIYALGDSDTEPPPSDDDIVPALTDVAETDYSYTDVYEGDSLWDEDEPIQTDGHYLWMKYKCIYADDHVEYTPAILITDSFLRSTTKDIQTSLTVVQGDIDALVYQTEIIGNSIDQIWADFDVSIGEIRAEVAEVYTDLDENYATKASLVLQINPETGHAEMVGEADYIYLYGNQIVIQSDNFTLDADGRIISTSGFIGGWTITTDAIYNGTNSMTSTTVGTYIGATNGIRQYGSSTKYINMSDGVLTACGAEITGTLTTTSGNYQTIVGSGYLEFYYSGSRSCYFYSDQAKSVRIQDAQRLWLGSTSEDDYRGIGVINSNVGIQLQISNDSAGTIGVLDQINNVWLLSREINNNTTYLSNGTSATIIRGTSISMSADVSVTGSVDCNGLASTNSISLTRYSRTIALYTDSSTNRGLYDSTYSRWLIAAGDDNYTYVGNNSVRTYVRGNGIQLNSGGGITLAAGSSGNYVDMTNDDGMIRIVPCASYSGGYRKGLYDSDGGQYIVWRDGSYQICLGNSTWNTVLYGSSVTLASSGAAVTSDRQLKDDITPFEPEQTDNLTDKLTPKIYTLTSDPETKHIGFVVDEVEDAMKAAGYDPDEYGLTTRYKDEDGNELGAIRYDEFIPILLYEIQELRDRVNALENPEEGLIDPGIELN